MTPPFVDLGHTPGVYYALSYFLSASVFLAVTHRQYSGMRQACYSALFLVALASFMFLTRGADGWLFAVSMAVIFSMIFVFFRFCSNYPWMKALYFSIRIFMLGEFAASFEWQMFYYGLTAMDLPLNMVVNIVFLLVIHPVVFGITYLMERRYQDFNESFVVTVPDLLLTALVGLLIFTLSNLSYATPDTPFSSSTVTDIFAIRTLADLAGVAILYGIHMQKGEAQSRLEKDYLHKLLHMQKENYRVSAESVDMINRKYHDLKHQIQLLRAEFSSEEKLQYLDEMEREIQSYEAQNKTGNKALDTILAAKSLRCQSLGISMTCVADGQELDFIKPTDLSVLFGNALDNAIESVEKLSAVEKRLIHVSVVKQKSFLRIRVENCYEGEIRFSSGLPTTRKDARYHGYGMKSIQSIVEKYNGSMTVKAADGWFELRILLPIPKDEPGEAR